MIYTNVIQTNKPMEVIETESDFKFLTEYEPQWVSYSDIPKVNKDTKSKVLNGFIAGEMKELTRSNDNLISRTLLPLDIDELLVSETDFLNNVKNTLSAVNYIIYKTFSYSVEKPRFRLVLELDRAVNKEEYELLVTRLPSILHLGYKPDGSNKTWSQLMLLPTKHENLDDPVVFYQTNQKPFPVDIALKSFDDIETPKKEQTITISHTSDRLDESYIYETLERYIDRVSDKLLERDYYLNAYMVIKKSVETGEMTQETAENCLMMLSCGNPDWEKANVEHFKKDKKPSRFKTSFKDFFSWVNKPERENKHYTWDDTGHADRFIDMYGDRTLYNYPNRSFYNYNGMLWELDEMGDTRSKVDCMVQEIVNQELVIPSDLDETEEEKLIKSFDKYKSKCRQTITKDTVLKEVRHRIPVKMSDFDSDKYLLNVKNGYLNLKTGELKEHDPQKLFTKVAGAEFVNQDIPMFKQFMQTIFKGDDELIEFVQKLMGYTMVGGNPEQIIVFFYGNSGRNGKSVLLYIMEKMMGSYHKAVQADTLLKKKNNDNGHTDALASLAGARLVTSSEPEKGYRLNESVIKQMTGGDTMTVSFKGKSTFSFEPMHTIYLACNYMPTMNAGASDESIWRRIVIVPFDVRIADTQMDVNLKNKIVDKELGGIIQWATEGYQKYLSDGLKRPDKIIEATDAERNEMDDIGVFLSEELKQGEGLAIKTTKVHEVYVLWSRSHGDKHQMSNTALTKELRARGLNIKRRNDGHYLIGYGSHLQEVKLVSG